jgi:hypothetical protein
MDDIPALVAEYLATALHLRADSPPATYQRANQLALHLGAVLPVEMWTRITVAISAGNAGAAWDVVNALRSASNLPAIPPELIVWHAPGIGEQPAWARVKPDGPSKARTKPLGGSGSSNGPTGA